jgi:hypothetical protein
MATHLQIPQITLTEAEDEFCRLVIHEDLSHEDALLRAGFAPNNAATVKGLLKRPEIQHRLNYHTSTYLRTIGVQVASKTMVRLSQFAESEAAQLGASKWLLEDSGHGVASRIADRNESNANRSLSEYSLSELEDLVKRGTETLEKLPSLKVIDISPSDSRTP